MKPLNVLLEASFDLDDPLQSMVLKTLLRLEVAVVSWCDDEDMLEEFFPGSCDTFTSSVAEVVKEKIVAINELPMPIPGDGK